MNKMIHVTGFVLVVVGALNFGLVGLFNFNLLHTIFGSVSWLERLIYILIGVASVILLATHKDDCKVCSVEPTRQHQTPPAG